MHIVLEHRYFFTQGNRNRHVIVLTPSNDPNSQLAEFHCLCVNVPEGYLIKDLLNLQHSGHPHGEHIPAMPPVTQEKVLSDREIEVLSLVAQGKINKENSRPTLYRTDYSDYPSQENTGKTGIKVCLHSPFML